MNSSKNIKSKSIDFSSEIKESPKIKISKFKSSTNLKYNHIDKDISLQKEEFGFELEQSLNNDNSNPINSFQSNDIYLNKLENSHEKYLYNNCKTYGNNNNYNEYNTTQKITFDDISIVSKINSLEGNENINIIDEDDDFLRISQNDIENKNNVNRYMVIINKLNKEKIELEENLQKEYLSNKELKNYNEIMKQTIENYIIKSGSKDIIDNISKQLNKTPVNLLNEFTQLKIENEKIKKNLILQQVLITDFKKEIENIKNENENLIKMNEKLKLEKNQYIKCENNNNENINLNYEENLKTLTNINKQLNQNYLNLQNDFIILNQNNGNIIKYNERLIKENEKLKKDINYLKESNNKEKDNKEKEIDFNLTNELINKIKNMENNNIELKKIIDKQKKEIGNMNEIINIKNNDITQYINEIQNYKKKEYETINDLIKKKENEISNLNNIIKNFDKIVNNIINNQIKEKILKNNNIKNEINKNNNSFNLINCYNDVFNSENINDLEDKIILIQNCLDILIKEINTLNKKLSENSDKEKNIKININDSNIAYKNGKYFLIDSNKNDNKNNDKKKLIILSYNDNIIKQKINNNEETKEKENIYNYNYMENKSFEDLTIIKKKEKQNSLNHYLFIPNNNEIINKDNEDYNITLNKNNNKNKNIQDNNNNKEKRDFLKNNKLKEFIKNPTAYNKNIKRNHNITKSSSTKQIKSENSYCEILKNKIIKNKKEKEKEKEKNNLDLLTNRKVSLGKNRNIEISIKDLASGLIINKEKKNNDYKENCYITMPIKVGDNFSTAKKEKIRSDITFSTNSNNLNEILTKNTKYSLGSQTIDSSSRIFNSNILSINNEYSSFKNNERIKEIRKHSQIYDLKKFSKFKNSSNTCKTIKNTNNLADEVLKPTFLKSDVNSTLQSYYTNPISNSNSKNYQMISLAKK